MPSLAVTQGGALLATWYDERDTASCGTQGSTTPCYRRFGRVSLNNGVTWQADDAVSDTVSPLPGQPDSTVQTLYAGDYDYSSANGTTAYTTWTDGRVIISGASQQDVNFDRVPLIQGTPTPTATPCSPVPCTSTPTNTATRTSTPTNTPSPTATVCGQYSTSAATGSVTPGTTNTGSSCDDCVTAITFPFPVQMYNNETYTSAGADF